MCIRDSFEEGPYTIATQRVHHRRLVVGVKRIEDQPGTLRRQEAENHGTTLDRGALDQTDDVIELGLIEQCGNLLRIMAAKKILNLLFKLIQCIELFNRSHGRAPFFEVTTYPDRSERIILGQLTHPKKLVRPEGFEPPTF